MTPHGHLPTTGLTAGGFGPSLQKGSPLRIRATEGRGCFVLLNKCLWAGHARRCAPAPRPLCPQTCPGLAPSHPSSEVFPGRPPTHTPSPRAVVSLSSTLNALPGPVMIRLAHWKASSMTTGVSVCLALPHVPKAYNDTWRTVDPG